MLINHQRTDHKLALVLSTTKDMNECIVINSCRRYNHVKMEYCQVSSSRLFPYYKDPKSTVIYKMDVLGVRHTGQIVPMERWESAHPEGMQVRTSGRYVGLGYAVELGHQRASKVPIIYVRLEHGKWTLGDPSGHDWDIKTWNRMRIAPTSGYRQVGSIHEEVIPVTQYISTLTGAFAKALEVDK